METLKGINLSDEQSPLGGQIIYLVYSSGKQVRLDVPHGAVETYQARGIPVLDR